jgi:predicted RNA-binding protein with PUA-like domain
LKEENMSKSWLFKTDPSEYSFFNLIDEEKYTWNNSTNIIEKKGIQYIAKGDNIIFYHGGNEKKIVGTAEALSDSYKKEGHDSERIVLDIKANKKFERPIALWELKLNPKFKDFDLLHIPQLNIFPVNDDQWDEILIMSEKKI